MHACKLRFGRVKFSFRVATPQSEDLSQATESARITAIHGAKHQGRLDAARLEASLLPETELSSEDQELFSSAAAPLAQANAHDAR